MTPVIDRDPPDGYAWPGADAVADSPCCYWLEPQTGWLGRTALFMVVERRPGMQRILAERCNRDAGVQIVDALRAVA